MIRSLVAAGIFVAAPLILSNAQADPLTRDSCWVAKFEGGSKRTICFLGSHRAKMTNYNVTVNGKGWSTCAFSGHYSVEGTRVSLKFNPNSGKCSNGADSPDFIATCTFGGSNLECDGSSNVGGQEYPFRGTFE
ncbi:MAG: hypothetical protein JSS20_17135 [Proteobacteria bacterium]|nr:hypothetical protein [Pseudomonadota bacterium]